MMKIHICHTSVITTHLTFPTKLFYKSQFYILPIFDYVVVSTPFASEISICFLDMLSQSMFFTLLFDCVTLFHTTYISRITLKVILKVGVSSGNRTQRRSLHRRRNYHYSMNTILKIGRSSRNRTHISRFGGGSNTIIRYSYLPASLIRRDGVSI